MRTFAQAAEASTLHLRSAGGEHEIDLIVQRDAEQIVVIEVKRARTVTEWDVRHLVWLRSPLGDDLVDTVIVTTGAEAYRREGIAVVPAALLGP